ncbi:VTT domain-containing protein [Pelagibacteraceae bacterium]|jgi:uncharacterized membrane protein YdjX (TVP38/TMEM64 family)|nr:VTT domain-containing protein [Pelagibacteraceae bacterium]|tara:strand:+ start:319 stop:1038 length:720 start_codon:yes stop_codon:yes gene_type:complete
MNTKFKIVLGVTYILCFGALILTVFNYLDFKELNNFNYIKSKSEILLGFKETYTIIFVLIFFIFSIVWILLLGFATPIALISGFIFGKWYGTIISVFSFTIGCTILYIFATFYLKDLLFNYLEKKIYKYKNLFSKNEFLYYLLFRFTGGPGIPFAIQNLLPVIFNMKVKNYFYATLLGLMPSIFIFNSLGSGINNLVEKNTKINYLDALKDPSICIPILAFIIIIILSFFLKKKFFKNN